MWQAVRAATFQESNFRNRQNRDLPEYRTRHKCYFLFTQNANYDGNSFTFVNKRNVFVMCLFLHYHAYQLQRRIFH